MKTVSLNAAREAARLFALQLRNINLAPIDSYWSNHFPLLWEMAWAVRYLLISGITDGQLAKFESLLAQEVASGPPRYLSRTEPPILTATRDAGIQFHPFLFGEYAVRVLHDKVEEV